MIRVHDSIPFSVHLQKRLLLSHMTRMECNHTIHWITWVGGHSLAVGRDPMFFATIEWFAVELHIGLEASLFTIQAHLTT